MLKAAQSKTHLLVTDLLLDLKLCQKFITRYSFDPKQRAGEIFATPMFVLTSSAVVDLVPVSPAEAAM